MTNQPERTVRRENRHDDPEHWQDPGFIDEWVTKDDARVNKRLQPMLDALASLPYPNDEAISVLDVGAGHGMFASQVFEVYPNAVVTLQDVSEPMFDIARERLAGHAGQLRYVQSDLSTTDWTSTLGGPFNLAVSSIAIHNLYDHGLIARVYKDIHGILKPGGTFINLEHVKRVGGVEGQVAWLRGAGFADVEALVITEGLARLSGRKAG